MARPLRIEYPNALHHVTSRGNDRRDIFVTDSDRRAFVELLAEVVRRSGWLCHAYCLMNNHYHRLVETPDANLGRGMRQINGVYTQRFNNRHGRSGHVFGGRYKSFVVEKQSYLLELCRYIVLNPVRAGFVNDAGDWPWSSYRATVGEDPVPAFLTTDWLLGHFADTPPTACAAYRAFVSDGAGADSPWPDVVGNIVLGRAHFREQLARRLAGEGNAKQVRFHPRPRPALVDLRRSLPDRAEWMREAHQRHGYTMAEIADAAGIHHSTVSRILRRHDRES